MDAATASGSRMPFRLLSLADRRANFVRLATARPGGAGQRPPPSGGAVDHVRRRLALIGWHVVVVGGPRGGLLEPHRPVVRPAGALDAVGVGRYADLLLINQRTEVAGAVVPAAADVGCRASRLGWRCAALGEVQVPVHGEP